MTSGTRHLGAALGSDDFAAEYVKRKVEKWSLELKTLTAFSKTEPQAAYSAFVFGFKGKWNFIQRTMPNCAPLLQPLEDLLRNSFIPTLTGRTMSDMEREIFSLPTRDGGLGIQNPSETAQQAFQDSMNILAGAQKQDRGPEL